MSLKSSTREGRCIYYVFIFINIIQNRFELYECVTYFLKALMTALYMPKAVHKNSISLGYVCTLLTGDREEAQYSTVLGARPVYRLRPTSCSLRHSQNGTPATSCQQTRDRLCNRHAVTQGPSKTTQFSESMCLSAFNKFPRRLCHYSSAVVLQHEITHHSSNSAPSSITNPKGNSTFAAKVYEKDFSKRDSFPLISKRLLHCTKLRQENHDHGVQARHW